MDTASAACGKCTMFPQASAESVATLERDIHDGNSHNLTGSTDALIGNKSFIKPKQLTVRNREMGPGLIVSDLLTEVRLALPHS
jgi:hypothetical protein